MSARAQKTTFAEDAQLRCTRDPGLLRG